ncbi:MAG: 3-phosphoshikimate 1-carboxyvinyltransferase [Acidimicrobiia bacterium]|nr:3-phosphoshikimate 1-carboxyvinyltransferase [Acidimicrobiia bacterium]
MTNNTRTVGPFPGPARGLVSVPGDKSLSHRALIFAAMAEGESHLEGLGPGEDIESTRQVLQALGVDITNDVVSSPGIGGWTAPLDDLDCGNSGTTLRLLAGALAGRPFTSTMVGDHSLSRRPMRRLVGPLEILGARVSTSPGGTAPVTVVGGGLRGADVAIAMASAQLRTAFTLAALQGDRPSRVDSAPGFRDHTERFLGPLGLGEMETATRFRVEPGAIPPFRYHVPGDPSSAAFLFAAAAITPGSDLTVQRIALSPGRVGFLDVLEAMGATVDRSITGDEMGEPVGDVRVRHAPLTGCRIQGKLAAAALDELPLLAVVAAFASGVTGVADAAELRAKESDRIASTVAMIRSLGGTAEEAAAGFTITGTGGLSQGRVETDHDHRIAMSAAVAATAAGPVEIGDPDVAAVSWPTFYADLESLWSS